MSLETRDLEFDNFRLDAKEKVLLRDEQPVLLTPKALQLLFVLVEKHGRIVSKEELMQGVWPDSFVEDSNLTFTISVLRKALGDSKYIQTVPKRGYRFIGEMQPPKVNSDDHKQGASPIDDSSVEVKTPTRHKKISLYAALMFVCIVALAGLVYGLYLMADLANGPRETAGLEVTRLTSSGNVRFAAAEPTGRYVAYVEEYDLKQSFWLKNVANGSSLQIALPQNAERVSSITFSPDGNSLFFGTNNSLYQVPVLGGPTTKILNNYFGGNQSNAITFSPDGSQLAFLRNLAESPGTTAIVTSNVDGSDQRNMAVSNRPEIFLRSTSWSPDGKTISCVVLNAAGHQEIALVRVMDGAVSRVPSYKTSAIRQVVWRPDGRGLLAVISDESDLSFQIWAIATSSGAARKLSNDLHDYRDLSLTAHPSKIFAVRAQQEAHLWVTSPDRSDDEKQISGGFQKFDGVYGLNWTSDDRIIYESSPSGKPEVWLVDQDGGNRQQIAFEGGTTVSSPDGKVLVYQSDDGTGLGLFRSDWKYRSKTRLTMGTDIDPTISSDGKWIVFTRFADDVGLWKVSAEGGKATKLTALPGITSYPSISPDGKLVAFFHNGPGISMDRPLTIVSFDSGAVLKTFATEAGLTPGSGKINLGWTPDSNAIDYVVHKAKSSNLWRQPLDGSAPFPITNFDSGLIFNFAPSIDGKQFVLSRGTFDRDVVVLPMPE